MTLVSSEVSEKHHRVMLACAASGEAIWERGHRYVFGIYALAKRYLIGILDMMARRGYKTVSLVYDESSPFNIDVINGAKKWAKKYHITIAYQQGYQNGKKDLSAILTEAIDIDAKGLLLSAYSPDCYELMRILEKHRYKPKVLGMTIAPIHPLFHQKAGDIAEGVFGPSQWEPDERIPFPGTKDFILKFKNFSGHTPSYHAGSAYAACQLFEQAILETRSFDNEKIRNYIAGLDTVTVIGRFKVDLKGKQIGHNPIIIQWQDGHKEIVWPTRMQTAPPVF